MPGLKGLLPKYPGANIKEFLVTILSEAKGEEFPLFEPEGRVWERSSALALNCSGASFRMVKKSLQ